MKRTLFLLLLTVCLYVTCEARTQQVCGYAALDGSFQFLRYFPDIKEGENYIDYGYRSTDVCIQRAVCLESFDTFVESCTEYNVDCSNRDASRSEFPACCVKC